MKKNKDTVVKEEETGQREETVDWKQGHIQLRQVFDYTLSFLL